MDSILYLSGDSFHDVLTISNKIVYDIPLYFDLEKMISFTYNVEKTSSGLRLSIFKPTESLSEKPLS